MKKKLLFGTVLFYCLGSAAQPTSGLMAYWPMNGNFTDNGPNNIVVTNNGATATTNHNGLANTAMNYSNPASTVVQFARHNPNANLNFGTSQDFSVDFTFYIPSPYLHTGGLYDNNLNYGGYGIWHWNANGYLQLNFNFKNGNIGTPSGTLNYNTYYHTCCVRSGSTMSIYINGVLIVLGNVGTTAPTYNFNARFGTMFYSAYSPPEYNGHNGKIDEFRIYNRALTAAEILSLSNIALPVKLSSFTAVNKNNTIGLNWQTQYEQNSSHFNIQRSTDGVNFTDIARVAAAGNSNLSRNYSYNDILTPAMQSQKTVFYRLQSVDMDGKFAYSQVLAIHLDKKEMQLLLSPNPAKDIVQVQTNSNDGGNASLIITDATGRRVYKKELLLLQGTNSIPVNISLLKTGSYSVQLVHGTESYIKQFIKAE